MQHNHSQLQQTASLHTGDPQEEAQSMQILSNSAHRHPCPLHPAELPDEVDPSGVKRQHPSALLTTEDIEDILGSSEITSKKVSSLFEECLSVFNEPTWVNFVTTICHSQIPKKSVIGLIKLLTEFIRNHLSISGTDDCRINKRSILVGYVMLAIVEMHEKQEVYLSPHEMYFLEMKEKELTKESIKIGCYILKMLELGERETQKEQNSLFSSFVDSIAGDKREERRRMLLDWASLERMSRFTQKVSSLSQDFQFSRVNTKQEQINDNDMEFIKSFNHETEIDKKAEFEIAKEHAKIQSITEAANIGVEQEQTSCNESVRSQNDRLEEFKAAHLDLLAVEELAQNSASHQDLALIEVADAEHRDLPSQQGEIQNDQQQQMLCSTADTSNLYPEAANFENMPQFAVVVENDEQSKDATEMILPFDQNTSLEIDYQPIIQDADSSRESLLFKPQEAKGEESAQNMNFVVPCSLQSVEKIYPKASESCGMQPESDCGEGVPVTSGPQVITSGTANCKDNLDG